MRCLEHGMEAAPADLCLTSIFPRAVPGPALGVLRPPA